MNRATALSEDSLPSVSIPAPQYDRRGVSTGIVHLGVGAFHRSHQAMFIDRLMAQGHALDWGICGVGVLPGDRRITDVLTAQDGLYTLVLKHPDGSVEPRVIGSITECLHAPADPEAAIERMAAPSTRIVSLTITEGGYNIDPVTGGFDEHNPAVLADLEGDAPPRTVFGLVVEALRRRRERDVPPFAVVSCDNLQGNGALARSAFTSFARRLEPALGDWVEQEVHFPSSMVDRITPVTTESDIAAVRDRFGVIDGWPVVCEPFEQWVLEDSFGAAGRPPLELAGVQLVDDVAPYELMKLRLLNASHQALCYLGYLHGYRYVHEAAQDPVFAEFLRTFMEREAKPTLEPVPGVDLDRYITTVVERFANPQVADTLARICADTSDRIPKFLLPVLREQRATGGAIELAALVVASWARYAEGVDEHGAAIEVVDPLRERLTAAASGHEANPAAFLEVREVFGDLADDERFRHAYVQSLRSLHERGAPATLVRVLGEATA
ncbi:mannitol dehydrogenase family protein [Georgenia wangjunii]|uniref:mannitol dehydrogenase family protein n=1 Tax=Georgenia wangjunii TaxID=3117730 RepID=UPI002F269087